MGCPTSLTDRPAHQQLPPPQAAAPDQSASHPHVANRAASKDGVADFGLDSTNPYVVRLLRKDGTPFTANLTGARPAGLSV
jgi:hypothetical protein